MAEQPPGDAPFFREMLQVRNGLSWRPLFPVISGTIDNLLTVRRSGGKIICIQMIFPETETG